MLTLNGRFYSLAELRAWDEERAAPELSEQERATLRFSRAWLTGQERFILPTSGSTGPPKPITLTREQMAASAQLTGEALGLAPGDRALVCLPVRYIAGRMMLVRGFVLDLALTVVEPSSQPFVGLPSEARFHFTALVPLQLQTILDQPEGQRLLEGMKAILVGGGPVSLALEQRLQGIRSPVYHTYGMTETVTHVALRRLNGPQASPAFRPLPGVELGVDERGCLTVRGPMTRGRLLHTNDRVELRPDGSFLWLGRVDNVINSGGVKVPVEVVERAVEEVLLALDRELRLGTLASRRFLVAGLPDPRLGQAVTLILEGPPLSPEVTQALLEALTARLPRYHAPRTVRTLPRFPETATGKIQRQETLRLLAQTPPPRTF